MRSQACGKRKRLYESFRIIKHQLLGVEPDFVFYEM